MATNKIKKPLKTGVLTGTWTTNILGGFATGLDFNSNPIVNAVRTDDPNATAYFTISAVPGGGQWVIVKKVSDNTAVANTSMAARLTYLIL